MKIITDKQFVEKSEKVIRGLLDVIFNMPIDYNDLFNQKFRDEVELVLREIRRRKELI